MLQLKDFTYGGRWFMPAFLAAPLVGALLFISTHGTPAQQIADPMSCSAPAVVSTITELVRKHIFTGGTSEMLDPARFDSEFRNVTRESKSPVTCSADFKPLVHVRKDFMEGVRALSTEEVSPVGEVEAKFDTKLKTRLTYLITTAASGKVHVEIIDGLAVYDD